VELALKIVDHARENGFQFGWVGGDGGYGKGPGFCIALDRMGEGCNRVPFALAVTGIIAVVWIAHAVV
jgi:hypothetical protein